MNSSGITFKFDVSINNGDDVLYNIGNYEQTRILNSQKFYDKKSDVIKFNSNQRSNVMWPKTANGLIDTIFTGYDNHIPLKFRPDDIWLAILISFGKYVNSNSESFKSKLVNHNGTKNISVFFDQFNEKNDWLDLTSKIMNEIKLNTKQDIIDWAIPTFTTTTDKDRLIANISLMSGLRKFFSSSGCQCCGLTEVTLEGTLNDWKELVIKAQKLCDFDDVILTEWAKLLVPILEEFCNAYEGIVREDFWQRICTNKSRGSGGEKKFRGWFMVFAPFSHEGKYILNPYDQVQKDNIYADIDDDEVGNAYCDIDVSITDSFNQTHIFILFGGILFTEYDKQNNILIPSVDYMIIKKKYIEFDDMRNIFYNAIKQWSYKKDLDMHNEINETIIKFVHFICLESNIPNTLFSNIASSIAMVTVNVFCFKYNESILSVGSIEKICEKCFDVFFEYDHEFGQYTSYMDKQMKNDLITKFISLASHNI